MVNTKMPILNMVEAIPPQIVYEVESSLYVTSMGEPKPSWSSRNYLHELCSFLNLFREFETFFSGYRSNDIS